MAYGYSSMVGDRSSEDFPLLHRVDGGSSHSARHRVVVVGGGFGGLQVVKALRGAPVEVILIDRNNYHLFQPLTYQVATGALSPDEITKPLRAIFREAPEVRVVMAEVTGFDLDDNVVFLRPGEGNLSLQAVRYDTLVVATGSNYSYFGHEDWRPYSLEVKSLAHALEARSRILSAFESAELEPDPREREGWLTFIVVGGGSTGVETAGQIAELARDTLPSDFRTLDPRAGRVLLVEHENRVLPSFPESLSRRAAQDLEELGVTVLTGRDVVGIEPDRVEIQARGRATEAMAARTVVWAAGVTASPLAAALADGARTDVDRAGRVTVEPDLALRGHPNAFAIGDMVRVRDAKDDIPRTLPGVAPVAMQQGRYVGRLIRARLTGQRPGPFRYRNKGSLATIGRSRAVADLPMTRIGGFAAWLLWLGVHLTYLIGFENRLVVLVRWSYYFFTHGRAARGIIQATESSSDASAPARVGVGSGERHG
jgi:NADH dehydrogenase